MNYFDDYLNTMETPDSKPDLLETQIGGKHYKSLGIEPVEYILANQIGFCEGNIIKYVSRYGNKNGIEDLYKAKHYLEILIQHLENKMNEDS
jgi:hypothetical protein